MAVAKCSRRNTPGAAAAAAASGMPVPHRHIRVVFLDTSSSRCGDVAADDEVLWVRIGRSSRGRGRGDEQVHGSGTVDGAYEGPDAQDGADRNEEERDEPGAVLRSEAFGHLLRNGGVGSV